MSLTSLKRQFVANRVISNKTTSVYSHQSYIQCKILDIVADRVEPLIDCINDEINFYKTKNSYTSDV